MPEYVVPLSELFVNYQAAMYTARLRYQQWAGHIRKQTTAALQALAAARNAQAAADVIGEEIATRIAELEAQP